MQVFSKIMDLTQLYPRIVMALGTFDGVHVGHQSIIRQAVSLAEKIQGISVVFTFSNHPLSVIAPEQAPLQIGDMISKENILTELGVDILVNIPFTKKFAKISPERFLETLQENFAPAYIVVGPNFSFGYRGNGNPRMLVREGHTYGFKAEIAAVVQWQGHTVSSTRIRELLLGGNLDLANEFLGRPFSFGGRVVHGDRRGRLLGFPTANLAIADSRAMLPNGVYAVRVTLQGKGYEGIANIGTNPTFEGCNRRLEVHILDFSGDIYDAALQVQFLKKIRDEQKFPSAEHLVRQLHEDKATARTLFDGYQ